MKKILNVVAFCMGLFVIVPFTMSMDYDHLRPMENAKHWHKDSLIEKYKKYNLQPFLRDCEKNDMFELLNLLKVEELSSGKSSPLLGAVQELLKKCDVSSKEIKKGESGPFWNSLKKIDNLIESAIFEQSLCRCFSSHDPCDPYKDLSDIEALREKELEKKICELSEKKQKLLEKIKLVKDK